MSSRRRVTPLKQRLAHGFAIGGYFGLLILTLVWHIWLFPSNYFPISLVLMVMAVPLLLPLRGLLHGRTHTFVWAGYLSMLYFVHGVGEAVANPEQRWLGLLEVVFSLMLVFGGSLFARWKVLSETTEG